MSKKETAKKILKYAAVGGAGAAGAVLGVESGLGIGAAGMGLMTAIPVYVGVITLTENTDKSKKKLKEVY